MNHNINNIISHSEAIMNEPESFSCDHTEGVLFSTVSPIKETPNEDSLAVIPITDDLLVVAIADGMGGMPAGKQASQIVTASLIDAITNSELGSPTHDIIIESIKKANHAIEQLQSGTTVAIAVIHGDDIVTYHAGDSLVLLISEAGEIRFQTKAHSPIASAMLNGLLDEKQAMKHPQRNLISNFIGDPYNSKIQIGNNIQWSHKETLLLFSDGLCDNLYYHEIVDYMSADILMDGFNAMLKECQSNMLANYIKEDRLPHPDDLSIIALRHH